MALRLHIPIGDLKLVSSSPADIHANPGEDVTLPCHLSLETSVVTMELKWLKRTDCIYLNKNGQGTEGRDYESRVSVLTEDLQKGNVSLRLRDITHSDNGLFRCQVIHGNCKLEETLLQHVESIQSKQTSSFLHFIFIFIFCFYFLVTFPVSSMFVSMCIHIYVCLCVCTYILKH